MGIEKLYRNDVQMTEEEQSIEEYNESESTKQEDLESSNIKIEGIESNNYKIKKYELVKETNIRYFVMNKNKRWTTYSECYNEQLEKVKVINKKDENKKYTIKMFGSEYESTYESAIDKMASDTADKKWILDTKYGNVVYSIIIKPETEKKQISEIENNIGFNGWINVNDLHVDKIQKWVI